MVAPTVPVACASLPVAAASDDELAGLAAYAGELVGIGAPRAVDVREIFCTNWHGIVRGRVALEPSP